MTEDNDPPPDDLADKIKKKLDEELKKEGK